MSPPPPQSKPQNAKGNTIRMAFFYAAVFGLIGIHLPFWPVWLAARGLGPTEIGVIMAASVGIKVVFNPLIAHVADRRGLRRPIMIMLAAGGFFVFALFGVTTGFWSILLVSVMFFALWSPIMPLGESLTMLSGRDGSENGGELDYGRIRLWGSLSFIATAVGAGYLLAGRSPDIIFWVLLMALVLIVSVTIALPATRAPAVTRARFASFEVLRDRQFGVFIAACAMIQASHSVYYVFGTLNWKAQGFSESVIGWLWAEGVAAEILLFAFGARLVGRLGPVGLIFLGGLAGALRWSLTGVSDTLEMLIALQLLHAFTFGATHLGAIYFITRRVPPDLSASAQGLYSAAVMGLALGLSALAAGKLFALFGAGAYQPMALLAAAGAGLAMFLRKETRHSEPA